MLSFRETKWAITVAYLHFMKCEYLTWPAARQILQQISTQIELNPAQSSLFLIVFKGNKWRATIEIHGREHIKARTKCSGKKKERKHNYIHFALHVNTPVWRQRVSLLCWHTRQMKDMQIALTLPQSSKFTHSFYNQSFNLSENNSQVLPSVV